MNISIYQFLPVDFKYIYSYQVIQALRTTNVLTAVDLL